MAHAGEVVRAATRSLSLRVWRGKLDANVGKHGREKPSDSGPLRSYAVWGAV